MHPLISSPSVWVTHSFLSVTLFTYFVAYMKISVFPAAVFFISATDHTTNELTWFPSVFNYRTTWVSNSIHVLCTALMFGTCAVPPPVLILRQARHLGVAVVDVVFKYMRAYSVFVFLLGYVPHMILIFIQIFRTFKEWDKIPEPFRHWRVE